MATDMSAKGVTHTVKCTSGRSITYRVVGRAGADDPALLFCSGMAMNGFQLFGLPPGESWRHLPALAKPRLTAEQLEALPWKIVCVNRPGYGASTMHGVHPRDWAYGLFAADALDVMDAVGASSFAALGVSSGGMNALAVAARAPGRVSAVGLVSADANYAPGFPKGRHANAVPPEDPRAITYVDGFEKCRPGGACGPCCCAGCCAGCCPQGAVADIHVEVKPLDFSHDAVRCPVHIIHGALDDTTDINCARWHATNLSAAELTVVPGEGHGEFRAVTVLALLKRMRDAAASTSSQPPDAAGAAPRAQAMSRGSQSQSGSGRGAAAASASSVVS